MLYLSCKIEITEEKMGVRKEEKTKKKKGGKKRNERSKEKGEEIKIEWGTIRDRLDRGPWEGGGIGVDKWGNKYYQMPSYLFEGVTAKVIVLYN